MAYTTANDRLSNSRAYTFFKCPQLYTYQYIEKLYPRPGTVSVENWLPRQRGTILHGALEYAILGKDTEAGARQAFEEVCNPSFPRQPAGPAQREALEALMPELVQVAKNAAEFLQIEDWEPLIFNGKPMVEIEVSHPIAGFKDFMGYVDIVMRHKPTGRVYAADWKSVTRFASPEDEVYRGQLLLYAKCLKHMGVHIDGAAIIQLKPELAKRATRKLRVDSGSIDGPRESECGKFMFTPTLYSEEYINNYFASFERTAQAMARFKPEEAYVNMGGFQCSGCDYKSLCQATLQGQDAEYIRNTKYTQSGASKRASLNIVI